MKTLDILSFIIFYMVGMFGLIILAKPIIDDLISFYEDKANDVENN